MKASLTTLAILSILNLSGAAFAQADDPVDRLLATVRDETQDLFVRGQAISSLLARGEGRGRDELAALLASPETTGELRLLIANGVLLTPDLPLLDPVLDLAVAEDELGGRVRELFRNSPSTGLVEGIAKRVDDPKVAPERRLALIRLYGHTGRREALDRLALLWESADASVSDEAKAAFERILPSHFEDAAAAKKFLDSHPKSGVADLAKLYEAGNGETKPDPAVPVLVELARKLSGDVGYERLLEEYLKLELPEIRKIGAEALAKYPWEEREEAGAKEARAKAAAVLLEVLDTEADDGVVVALLAAARSLTGALLGTDPERTNYVVTRRLESGSRAVRLAAIDTLGKLGDPRAIGVLQTQFDGAGEADAAYRLAVLDALELILRTKQGLGDGGVSDWFIAKLDGGEKLDEVVLRLIKILGVYQKLDGAVDPLAALLGSSANSQIRRMAAIRLGILGAGHGVPAALAALSDAVVEDKDPSVREVSATALGRTPRGKVTDDVVQKLTNRLGEGEPEAKVRTAAANSLLRLRGAEVLPALMPLVADDDVWQQAVLAWLNSEVLAAQPPEAADGRTAMAAVLVRSLREAKAWARCQDAAGRILDATTLVWTGPAATNRLAIVLDRAWAVAETGKPAEALALLPDAEMPAEATDGDSFDLIFLRARLQRRAGKAADAIPALQALLVKAPSIPGAEARAVRLELGECHLAGRDWDAATESVAPLLEDPDYAERAAKIDERATQGRQLAQQVADLASEDPAVRQAAVDALKGLGEFAYPALDRWLTEREGDPAGAAAAVKTIAEILDKPLVYDPAAPEEARRQALAAAHAALRPGA